MAFVWLLSILDKHRQIDDNGWTANRSAAEVARVKLVVTSILVAHMRQISHLTCTINITKRAYNFPFKTHHIKYFAMKLTLPTARVTIFYRSETQFLLHSHKPYNSTNFTVAYCKQLTVEMPLLLVGNPCDDHVPYAHASATAPAQTWTTRMSWKFTPSLCAHDHERHTNINTCIFVLTYTALRNYKRFEHKMSYLTAILLAVRPQLHSFVAVILQHFYCCAHYLVVVVAVCIIVAAGLI